MLIVFHIYVSGKNFHYCIAHIPCSNLSYTIPTFRHGWKKGFSEDELYEVMPEFRSARLGDKLEAAWNIELTKDKPSLFRALKKTYFRYFLRFCFILIMVQLVRFVIHISTGFNYDFINNTISEYVKLYLCII